MICLELYQGCLDGLFVADNKLLDSTGAVCDENLQLKIENEKLRKGLIGAGNSSELERIQALEQKLLAQQEELTDLHKRRGEHAQQIVDLNSALLERDKLVTDKDQKIRSLSGEVATLRLEVSFGMLASIEMAKTWLFNQFFFLNLIKI